MQSLKVRGPFGSLDFQTLLVLGPLQKLLLPFIFRGSVPLWPPVVLASTSVTDLTIYFIIFSIFKIPFQNCCKIPFKILHKCFGPKILHEDLAPLWPPVALASTSVAD